MTKTIYKYPLVLGRVSEVIMPQYAQILHVKEQNGIPCIWAEVNLSNGLFKRIFHIIGTGHDIPDNGIRLYYVGTCHIDSFVWHVYEEIVS